MFNNALGALGDKAKLMQLYQQLQQEKIEIEHQGVKIVMRGDGQILNVIVDDVEEPRIAKAFNNAQDQLRNQMAQKLSLG